MMQNSKTLTFFIFSFFSAIAISADTTSLLQKISINEATLELKSFAQVLPVGRTPGTPSHAKAVEYLTNRIKALDSKKSGSIYLESFRPDVDAATRMYQNDFQTKVVPHYAPSSKEYHNWSRFTSSMSNVIRSMRSVQGKNLIWEKSGKDNSKILVIGAHFDTLLLNKENNIPTTEGVMPGIDNNATGIVTLLKCIQILSQLDLNFKVRIVFFDMQEYGQLGSKYHVSSRLEEYQSSLIAFINPLMLGHDTRDKDKERKLYNMKSYLSSSVPNIQQKERDFIGTLEKMVIPLRLDVKFPTGQAPLDSSDNASFAAHNLPAVVFTQNIESDYNDAYHHSGADLFNTINYKTFAQSVRYIVGAVTYYLTSPTEKKESK